MMKLLLLLAVVAGSLPSAADDLDCESYEIHNRSCDYALKGCYEELEKYQADEHKKKCSKVCRSDAFGAGKFKGCYDLCMDGSK